MEMLINVIVQMSKLKNKRKELNKKKFHIFMTENGVIKLTLKPLKISSQLLDLKAKLMDQQF